ncbi:hypothetical protein DX900_21545 [Serratia marcescens]|nr:hypothetical protein DX900_21545 [Serratia marcescens]TFZ87885.1 hypothetical protein E4655_01570 [Serratia marcescens]
MFVPSSQTQKPAIKAEDEEHSGTMFESDNAESGFLGRDPQGWGYFAAPLRYSPFIWPTKPHGSRLAAQRNNHQRCSRTMTGRSLYVVIQSGIRPLRQNSGAASGQSHDKSGRNRDVNRRQRRR